MSDPLVEPRESRWNEAVRRLRAGARPDSIQEITGWTVQAMQARLGMELPSAANAPAEAAPGRLPRRATRRKSVAARAGEAVGWLVAAAQQNPWRAGLVGTALLLGGTFAGVLWMLPQGRVAARTAKHQLPSGYGCGTVYVQRQAACLQLQETTAQPTSTSTSESAPTAPAHLSAPVPQGTARPAGAAPGQTPTNPTPATPPAPNWQAIAAAAAPYVYYVQDERCTTLGGCNVTSVGSGYAAMLPWPAGSGQAGLVPSVVTAAHMVCRRGTAYRIDVLAAGPVTLTDTNDSEALTDGLCYDPSLGGDLGQDVASISSASVTAGLTLASAPAQPGAPVLLLGHPEGESVAAPVAFTGTVVATGLTLQEASIPGTQGAQLHNVIEVALPAFPGDSGAPVLNAAGQVIGTFVAWGPSAPAGAPGHQVARQLAYVIPWGAYMAPIGFRSADGLVNQLVSCGGNWLERQRCRL